MENSMAKLKATPVRVVIPGKGPARLAKADEAGSHITTYRTVAGLARSRFWSEIKKLSKSRSKDPAKVYDKLVTMQLAEVAKTVSEEAKAEPQKKAEPRKAPQRARRAAKAAPEGGHTREVKKPAPDRSSAEKSGVSTVQKAGRRHVGMFRYTRRINCRTPHTGAWLLVQGIIDGGGVVDLGSIRCRAERAEVLKLIRSGDLVPAEEG
jgi:hypothetical protein